jgi:hypothetical protein
MDLVVKMELLILKMNQDLFGALFWMLGENIMKEDKCAAKFEKILQFKEMSFKKSGRKMTIREAFAKGIKRGFA